MSSRPPRLIDKPYLQPVFDEPDFIVRNVWRVEGGWFDGIPSHLKPAPKHEQAREIAALAGGSERLLERALARMKAETWRWPPSYRLGGGGGARRGAGPCRARNLRGARRRINLDLELPDFQRRGAGIRGEGRNQPRRVSDRRF